MIYIRLEHIATIFFRDSLIYFLGADEKAEADDGYKGEDPHNIKCPMNVINPKVRKIIDGKLSNRQETVNKCFKD